MRKLELYLSKEVDSHYFDNMTSDELVIQFVSVPSGYLAVFEGTTGHFTGLYGVASVTNIDDFVADIASILNGAGVDSVAAKMLPSFITEYTAKRLI